MRYLPKFFIVCFAVFCLLCIPSADTYAEDDVQFLYTIIGGKAIITGCEQDAEFIEIPSVIESCPVTEIGSRAFSNHSALKRVIFPETLRKIGDYSFYACYSLETANLPSELEKLGEGAFCGCTQLAYMGLPEKLTEIPDSCFRACTNMTETEIPWGVKKIGSYSFSGCTKLGYVSLGGGLEKVGERAFFMCGELRNVYIPSSVKEIGREAFGFIPSNDGAAVKNGFRIFGCSDATAQKYAEFNGIEYHSAPDALKVLAMHDLSAPAVKISERTVLMVLFSFIILYALKNKYRKKLKKLKKVFIRQ